MATKKIDYVQASREKSKLLAIKTVKKYAAKIIADYTEPQRSRRRRGDKIDVSKAKLYAAILCSLYPRALSLKEIAKIAGVGQRVLLTWRTQKDFMDLIKRMSLALGGYISIRIDNLVIGEKIESWRKSGCSAMLKEKGTLVILKSERKNIDIDKWKKDYEIKRVLILDDSRKGRLPKDPIRATQDLVTILSFANKYVVRPFTRSIKQHIKYEYADESYIQLSRFALQKKYIHNEASLRDWEARPEVLDLTKATIKKDIDLLSNPEAWEFGLASPDGRKILLETAQNLKRIIFKKLDILAKKP